MTSSKQPGSLHEACIAGGFPEAVVDEGRTSREGFGSSYSRLGSSASPWPTRSYARRRPYY